MEEVVKQYDFNLVYANELVKDLSEEQMTTTPSKGLVNHPAFTLGHLVTGSGLMVKSLGGEYDLPEGWDELFRRSGPGDPTLPSTDLKRYPNKQELLDVLSEQHELVKMRIIVLSNDELNELVEWRFSRFMPTMKDLITFMCVNHEAMHLSQLAAWRREMGLPSALGRI